MPCRCPKFSLINQMSRIFAISDLHVDMPANHRWVEGLTSTRYKDDVIIVAGDVTDDIDRLKKTLGSLKEKFKHVCYVPGNHELWIRTKRNSISPYKNSIEKFHGIVEACSSMGVHTQPLKVNCPNESHVWVVPLFSWYSQPEEGLGHSLFVPQDSENVEFTQKAWMDNHFCVWSNSKEETPPAQYFADLNNGSVSRHYDAPVISFSHFVPRFDLIPASEKDLKRVANERKALGLSELENPRAQGSNIKFNFTRYAGSKLIEKQIRELRSVIHVFGHQHRNRDCVIDDVRYISHCFGYPAEREKGLMWGIEHYKGPKLIWP